MKVTAQVVEVECRCGGMMVDVRTGGGMITGDTNEIECLDCQKVIDWRTKAPKTARMF